MYRIGICRRLPISRRILRNSSKGNDLPLVDGAFARRADYQKYLATIQTQLLELGKERIAIKKATVLGITGRANNWTVQCSSGETVQAKQIVCAVGNFPPAPLRSNAQTALYIENNPWRTDMIEELLDQNHIAFIGTGLTAIDFVWELTKRNYTGTITMLSRGGLVPKAHDLSVGKIPWDGPHETVKGMFRHARGTAKNGNWRAVIDGLRESTQQTWQQWNENEKKRFFRHIKSLWGVLRHRVAHTVAEKLISLQGEQTTYHRFG